MPFQKGKSGNPGGRKPIPDDIKELWRAACPEAAKRVIKLAKSADENVAFKACALIWERAYGKPAQPLDGDGEGGPIGMSVEVRFVNPPNRDAG